MSPDDMTSILSGIASSNHAIAQAISEVAVSNKELAVMNATMRHIEQNCMIHRGATERLDEAHQNARVERTELTDRLTHLEGIGKWIVGGSALAFVSGAIALIAAIAKFAGK